MLVERLWPQPKAAPAARRSVTFAGSAAPAVRAASAAPSPQDDPALWRSEALDRLAIALAAPELLSRQPAAQMLLGRLLAGKGPLPLIGQPAALAALDALHQPLRAAASPAGVNLSESRFSTQCVMRWCTKQKLQIHELLLMLLSTIVVFHCWLSK